jgi:hypothetical protein
MGPAAAPLSIVAAFASLIVLAACGAGPTAVTVVAGSYASTVAAKTADVAVTSTESMADNGTTVTTTGSGVVDYADHASDIHDGTGDGAQETITIGSDVYSKSPFELLGAAGATSWLHSRRTTCQNPLANLTSLDPSRVLSYLQSISRDVTDIGHDSLRGTPSSTTRPASIWASWSNLRPRAPTPRR